MRISSVNTYNYNLNKTTKIKNNKVQSKVLFKGFDEDVNTEYLRLQNLRKNDWNRFWNSAKDLKEAKSIINERYKQNEIEGAKNKVRAEYANKENDQLKKDYENSVKTFNETVNNMKDRFLEQQEIILKEKKEKENILDRVNQMAEIQNAYQKMIEEERKINDEQQSKMTKLFMEREAARDKNDKELLEIIQKQILESNDMYKKLAADISGKKKVYEPAMVTLQKTQTIDSNTGFGRIAGYDLQKRLLTDIVGSSILEEKINNNANVANAILFFGPKGCGKTKFATSFAEQLDCKLEKIPNRPNDQQNLDALCQAAERAKEHYDKTGQRTVLLINEFEQFINKGNKQLITNLSEFMDNISKNYNATIFATTNYPEEINKSILKSDKFAIIAGLPNPDETNMANVIKYYATGFAESDIDYLEIAKSIINKNPQKSYSNASIERILKDFYNNNRNVANFKITKEDIIRLFTINNKPDITQKELKLFQKQIALLKNIG